MISTENVTFQYPEKGQTFSFPDMNLKQGENLLILGKSGVGKTTLLHLLAGLLQPTSGNITINKKEINTLSPRKLDTFRGQNIGLVFQKNYAIQSLTVIENLQARLLFSKVSRTNNELIDLLTELQLIELKNRKIQQLSEGQLQRLGIALSVIHQPKIILADEPTSSLDDENCTIVIELLKKQAQKNNANLIVITHDNRIKSSFQNSITL